MKTKWMMIPMVALALGCTREMDNQVSYIATRSWGLCLYPTLLFSILLQECLLWQRTHSLFYIPKFWRSHLLSLPVQRLFLCNSKLEQNDQYHEYCLQRKQSFFPLSVKSSKYSPQQTGSYLTDCHSSLERHVMCSVRRTPFMAQGTL